MKKLVEYWLQDVTKEMEEEHTEGTFTQWCIKNGFKKASYACIKKAIEEADKILDNPNASEKQRKMAVKLKKRAILARTFKKIAKKRKNS